MAYTSYITIDGTLVGEETNGVMRNYGTDALGSVVTTTLNGVAENTYRYKPYGGLLAKTGTAADPSFLWNGGNGYRATKLTNSEFYVRARHLCSTAAQWTTRDLLWPGERAYAHAGSNPAVHADPSGLQYTLSISYLSGGFYQCGCSYPVIDCTKIGQWSVSPGGTGWIVQHIAGFQTRGGCGSQPITGKETPYFEAWRVVAGVVYCGWASSGNKKGTDTWGIGVYSPACEQGSASLAGQAYFFADPVAASVAQWRSLAASCGSSIPYYPLTTATTPDPPFWSQPSSNLVERDMVTTYNCCDKNCQDPKGPSCCQLSQQG